MAKATSDAVRSKHKIFGLSITEQIAWGFAEATWDPDLQKASITRYGPTGIFEGVPIGNIPDDRPDFLSKDYFDIQQKISDAIDTLREQHSDWCKSVEAVGVSTIGVVDREGLFLVKSPRKPWRIREDGVTIDFSSIFINRSDQLFQKITKDMLVIHSDASARCLSEYKYRKGLTPTDSILYIIAGEGVNAAFHTGSDLLKTKRNSEMGHMYTLPHSKDADFSRELSGCPAHAVCLEGLLSDVRFRKQWGATLATLPDSHVGIEIAAYYLAQLAWSGILALDPSRVIFSGAHFSGGNATTLLAQVKANIDGLNNGLLRHVLEKNFITISEIDNHNVKLLSALDLACTCAFKPRDKEPIFTYEGNVVFLFNPTGQQNA